MKKIILSLAILSLVACNGGSNATNRIEEENLQKAEQEAQNANAFPEIFFEKTEHDFGRIKNGTPVDTYFKLTNTGKAPLVITSVSASCGCTTPEKPEKPILPGETGQIKVAFNGSGKDLVTKTVTVNSNAQQSTHTLTIKAFVVE